ncbi:DUF7373 family lipoprotein [Nocardia shimofusensis]|uniref:DUF7373 family lipoprotein n=1 Tax=Nocardia shimofusensis TaxID=228596 RepID=UPI00082CD563|nr:hypothetical protein [Nocardia shimofusensis]
MRKKTLARTALTMATAAALSITGSGCGSDIEGTPVRAQTDLSTLDVGNFRTAPEQLGNAENERQARVRESQRLGDYVALPFEADPSYTEDVWFLSPHVVLDQDALGTLVINDTFDDVAQDLVAGWVNAWSTGGGPDDPRRTMNIAVLMFPDAATADEVGPALEHDDFTYNPGNEPVTVGKYPASKAHWRPTVSSIGSWTVRDRYVVFVKIDDEISPPDLPALTAQVEKILDVQIPLLDEFEPTPADQLRRIPLDPEGLLGRTLPTDPATPIRADPDGLYTGRAILSLLQADPGDLDMLREHDVDLVAFGDAVVFRSRDAENAVALWQLWRPSAAPKPEQRIVEPPSGLGDNVECYADLHIFEGTERVRGHLCVLQVDRYTVQAFAPQLQVLHQKVSAQYALLTAQ